MDDQDVVIPDAQVYYAINAEIVPYVGDIIADMESNGVLDRVYDNYHKFYLRLYKIIKASTTIERHDPDADEDADDNWGEDNFYT